MKKLHKRIMLSEAYRRSSEHNAMSAEADPDNRLLWRYPKRRLEAEAIRDGIHQIAGTLDRTMGGVMLPQTEQNYVDAGKAQYDSPRRSIYLPVIRSNVYDFFEVFDFVEPSVSNGHRVHTVVAPQALYLMNNPLIRRQAEAWAKEILKIADERHRVERMIEQAYSRPAKSSEMERALQFIRNYEEKLSATEKDAAKRSLEAWATYGRTIFASSEFIYLK